MKQGHDKIPDSREIETTQKQEIEQEIQRRPAQGGFALIGEAFVGSRDRRNDDNSDLAIQARMAAIAAGYGLASIKR